ncbi:S-adenosyl-l-methionine hydroxide adenosyltransferase family protein [Tissierella praeacuta]|uniref:SAM hydrolase/SAM-dependent halogenase family protein n=1 Tax=Tissierella praeacuta TaxID=43131 RepID=UPI003342CC29
MFKSKVHNLKKLTSLFLAFVLAFSIVSLSFTNKAEAAGNQSALVFLTDFGLKDGAVSAMKGVSFGVSSELKMFDVTHDIPSFDIWEGAYRFKQTCGYWPKGTVFVGVVDPGVGTERASIVLKTKSGHYFVGPDNGLFGLVAEDMGIEEIRQIDETKNRLKGSEKSYTFHGRDIFAYVGARLASGQLKFEDVGPKLEDEIVTISYQKATIKDNTVMGNIPVLDIQYGNIWSNIPDELFEKLDPKYGDMFKVEIFNEGKLVYTGNMPYVESFGEVAEGKPMIYFNSLLNVSAAINMGSFAEQYKVSSGAEWTIKLTKVK